MALSGEPILTVNGRFFVRICAEDNAVCKENMLCVHS